MRILQKIIDLLFPVDLRHLIDPASARELCRVAGCDRLARARFEELP